MDMLAASPYSAKLPERRGCCKANYRNVEVLYTGPNKRAVFIASQK